MTLYPCPCCGSTDIEEEDCSNMQENGTRIACNDCGLQVEGYGASDCTSKAIRAWNRREYAARILAQRDRLYMALVSVKNSIVCAPADVICDTLWMSETETTVDYIDAALAELDKEKQS